MYLLFILLRILAINSRNSRFDVFNSRLGGGESGTPSALRQEGKKG
jgi:hypothetical protein